MTALLGNIMADMLPSPASLQTAPRAVRMECSETLLMDASRQGENEAERVRELVDAIYRTDS